MALEISRFFDYSEEKGNEYSADEFAEYFRTFFADGVLAVNDTNLQVTASDAGLLVTVGYGAAIVQGYWYRLKDDSSGAKTLSIAAAHASLTRIDRVILRLDKSMAVSNVVLAVLAGTAAASPAAPALTREGNIYELSLAKVTVSPGVLSITADKVTDERSDNSVCGMVEPLSIRNRMDQDVRTTASPTFNVLSATKVIGAVFQ
jgi:hypothetical protein